MQIWHTVTDASRQGTGVRVINPATWDYLICNMASAKSEPRTLEDAKWMAVALREARRAERAGEVPIGACVVIDGRLLARGFNRPIGACDPTAHAEVVALRRAAKRLGNYRLAGATVYVTLEPCVLCVGALMQARVARVVYGAAEPKFGAIRSMHAERLPGNHRFQVLSGVAEAECRALVSAFFRHRREKR